MTFSSFCYSEEDDEGRRFYEGQQRVSGPALYPHNTYHGPGLGYNQHQRTPLAQANFRPLKFTDTPVNHYNPRVEDEQGLQDHDEVPKTKLIFFLSFALRFLLQQLIAQYPPPPPVATGPGLDRPLYIPTPDYTSDQAYTMNRTRMFYQDQMEANEGHHPPPVNHHSQYIFSDNGGGGGQPQQPQSSSRGERRKSGERPSAFASLDSPRRLENETRW